MNGYCLLLQCDSFYPFHVHSDPGILKYAVTASVPCLQGAGDYAVLYSATGCHLMMFNSERSDTE